MRYSRLLLTGAFFCLAAPLSAAPVTVNSSTNLDVYVKDQNGAAIASVQVVAIHFSSSGPDASLSQTSVTNAAGLARFSGSNALVNFNNYDVFATSSGYLPSLRDQYNDPGHPSFYAAGVYLSTPTIILSTSNATNIGEIDSDVANADPSILVFGSVRPNLNGPSDPIAFGLLQTDAGGGGRLKIFNVPYSTTSTYRIDVYDPTQNKSVSNIVDKELAAYRTLILNPGTGTLDFNNSIPPITTVNQAQQSGNAGNLSVDGVVLDTRSINSVPFIGLNFQGQYSTGFSSQTDFRWAQSDANGRFQLYGLLPGVTYYTQAYGGCSYKTGLCYQGSVSTALATGFGSAPGVNDFFYASTATTLTEKIKLKASSGGNGVMQVYVKDSRGNPIPQAYVGVFGDGQGWETSGSCTGSQVVSNPGLANANAQATTGYALLSNLPPGNYVVQAWTPFSNQDAARFNDGPNGHPCWKNVSGETCQCGNTDDLRVTIDTTSTPDIRVFDASGVQLGATRSSITITVSVSTNNTGSVQGNLTFPQGGVDLSNDPINITLQVQCVPGKPCGQGGNFAFFNNSSTGPVIHYAISVATGQAYWMDVISNYWGVVRQGGGQNQVDLASASVVTENLVFARAGRLAGKLYKPDGSVYQTTNNSTISPVSIDANGQGVNSWGTNQVNQDGSFTIGGLLPGVYTLQVNSFGTSFVYSTPRPAPTATISTLKDTYQDVYLAQGTPVRVSLNTASLPPLAFSSCPPGGSGKCPPENWSAIGLARGSPISQDVIANLLFHNNGVFRTSYIPNPFSPSECSTPPSAPGFCVDRIPSPSNYDFYLFREGDFDQQGFANPPTRPYLVLLNSTRNVVVSDQLATIPYFVAGSTLFVRDVNLTPSSVLAGTPQMALKGAVTGKNIFRQQDFASLNGDSQNFIKFLPVMSLYDSNNSLKAFGLSVPNPTCFFSNLTIGTTVQTVNAWFDQALANGDFSLFQNVFNNCPGGLGYDIRGISSGTYSAVMTTPNYPSCQNTVTLSVNGSTTTLNIDLDSCAGSGASLTGVVTSTMGVALANASISIQAAGYPSKSAVTDSSGSYRFDGLPAGTYHAKVVAPGYALAGALTDITGTSVFTSNFVLRAAGASITGTVYAQKVPYVQAQPGAQVLAYNDSFNVLNPSADLPLYKTVTSSVGFYSLDGLEVGSTYKIFVKMSGKYILGQSTKTVAGTNSGMDFTLLSKPLTIQVFGRPAAPNYEFTILNASDFKSGRAWIGPSPFVLAAATEVTSGFQFLPNNQLLLQYLLSNLAANTDYTFHIEALSLAGGNVTKEITFGINRQASADQNIDDTLLGDDSSDERGNKSNQAHLDASGSNASNVSIPTGAMISISSSAVPTVQFTQLNVSASTLPAPSSAGSGNTSAYVSGIYQLTLSSINYTDKGFDLTLAYDKSSAQLGDIAAYHFNDATQKWEIVPGQQTVDAVLGTITVRRIKSLASVLGLKRSSHLLALSNGQTYMPNPAYQTLGLRPDDSGSFAVLRPSLVGTSFAGTVIKIFNFPNPFNLSSKTLNLANGGGTPSITTNGTVIKIELPAGINGQGRIRIYTLAGELVRELDLGGLTGGSFIYTQWDGKNKSGVDVANGVYYGILSIPGVKAKDATFKMAVIK